MAEAKRWTKCLFLFLPMRKISNTLAWLPDLEVRKAQTGQRGVSLGDAGKVRTTAV